MIIKKLLIFGIIVSVAIMIFVIFFWDIPAPKKLIEKDLDIQRLNKNDQR